MVLFLQGRPNEGLDWSELQVRGDPTALLELRQLHWQAVFLDDLGSWSDAIDRVQKSARLAERIGATHDLAFALRLTGIINIRRDPFDAARVATDFRRAYALYEQHDDVEGKVMMLNNLAVLADDATQAQEKLERARHMARDAGETHALAMASGSLAELLLFRTGDYLGARKAAEESIACHQATGASLRMAHECTTLGQVLVMLGEVDDAEATAKRVLAQGDALHASAADEARGVANALFGTVERIRGNPELAADRFREALHLLESAPKRDAASRATAFSMNGLTRIALDARRAQEARRYADRATEFLREHGASKANESTGIGLIANMHLGEALALQGLLDAAELQLQATLRRASEEHRIPAVLALLFALTEVRRQRDPSDHASDVVALVATHPASSFELTRRAGTVLTDLVATGSPPRTGAIELADAVALTAHGGSGLDA